MSMSVRGAAAVLALSAAGVLAGTGLASAATTTPEVAPFHGDYCDGWQHRWEPVCQRNTRWYWHGDQRGHGQWQQWRYDGHRWNHR